MIMYCIKCDKFKLGSWMPAIGCLGCYSNDYLFPYYEEETEACCELCNT